MTKMRCAKREQGIAGKGIIQAHLSVLQKAAELGDPEAHFKLSAMYNEGVGAEEDKGKEIHHLEEAAIGGHPDARYCLGCHEYNNGNAERAVEHWNIAATQGNDNSIKWLLEVFKQGLMEKEDLAAALRAHKAAVDATKSPQREAAEVFYFGRRLI